jgi:hypothetical protein
MDYAVVQPGLVAWAKELTGLTVVVWQNERRPQSPDGRLGVLSWVSSGAVGQDETRWEDTDTDDERPVNNMVPDAGRLAHRRAADLRRDVRPSPRRSTRAARSSGCATDSTAPRASPRSRR